MRMSVGVHLDEPEMIAAVGGFKGTDKVGADHGAERVLGIDIRTDIVGTVGQITHNSIIAKLCRTGGLQAGQNEVARLAFGREALMVDSVLRILSRLLCSIRRLFTLAFLRADAFGLFTGRTERRTLLWCLKCDSNRTDDEQSREQNAGGQDDSFDDAFHGCFSGGMYYSLQ